MTYITREDVLSTLVDMKSFYQELKHVFQHAGMNIEDNLGRRNILMSQVQEEFLARALSRRYENVIADGSPGKADIFIADHDREIECKLGLRRTVQGEGFLSVLPYLRTGEDPIHKPVDLLRLTRARILLFDDFQT